MEIGRRAFLALGGLVTTLSTGAAARGRSLQGSREAVRSNVGHFSSGGPTERADYERITIPYKARKGIEWPNGARIAAICYIAAEYWEANIFSEDPKVKRSRDWLLMSEYSWYGFQNAIFRSMDLFDRHGLRTSALLSGLAGQYYPQIVEELKDRGHEIAAHEWDQSKSAWNQTRAEERESIRKTTTILEKAGGVRPVGWINPGARCSEDTVEFLVNENYLWHGDLRDDDLPYGVRYQGKTIVRIPHINSTHNDFTYYGFGGTRDFKFSPQKAFEYMKDVVDAYLERSKEEPLMMQIGHHPFVGANPARIVGIDKFLEYMRSKPGIWWCTYKDVAEYWKKTYLGGV